MTGGPRAFFQRLSYLQYPAMLAGLVYAARPLFTGLVDPWDDWNAALLYAGVGIGMASLQDPTRTQNAISKTVWQHPRNGRIALWVLTFEALVPIVIGLIGASLATSTALNQLSLGLVAFGLGMIGLLKTAIEMFDHHCVDRRQDRIAHLAGETA